MKVAFIGTGSMGGSMARNLAQAGIDITVFDLNAESLKKPAAAGAKVATSAADCVKGVDILITMLPTPAAIDAVMMGSGGVGAALEPNAL
jgi:3-hydroxyisobutyrate dehydrogenase